MENHFSFIEHIEAKRDGRELPAEALRSIISRFTADEIPAYQMSAFLMAVLWRGMTDAELSAWTEAMLRSGDVLDFSDIPLPKVDKHSTGGVGDKVSIPLAPMVAACGVAVPMMSGRGLGHTGGTLDKLESIPGFRSRLDPDEFRGVLTEHGMVLAGQSETLVPADKRIYALRDASGTVPSIPLIASSIMSKKLAEDLDSLVLDVKVGSGAFMKDADSARVLAETMVRIGDAHGTRVKAVLTNMDQPLGAAVGNAVEIEESLDLLVGGGPEDLQRITFRLGAEMLVMGGVAPGLDEAEARLREAVDSGRALEKFGDVVAAQGGDPGALTDRSLLPHAAHEHVVAAPEAGWVAVCDALDIGVASVRLGGGRQKQEDDIDHAVGISVEAKVGDRVETGQTLARVAYNGRAELQAALPLLERAWEIAAEPVQAPALIIDTVAL
jgi:pyrimidine-nucleoside phosphorylase/thymidine phosphorylase